MAQARYAAPASFSEPESIVPADAPFAPQRTFAEPDTTGSAGIVASVTDPTPEPAGQVFGDAPPAPAAPSATPRPSASLAPPPRPVSQAPVGEGILVAVLLVCFTGFGVFLMHKVTYEATRAMMGSVFEAQEWTEEELEQMPPELRQLIEDAQEESETWDDEDEGDVWDDE